MKPEYSADDALSRRIFRDNPASETPGLAVHQPFSRAEFIALQKENLRLQQILQLSSGLRQRFDALYDAFPIALLSLDADDHIIEANLCFAQLLGSQRSPLMGQHLGKMIAAEDHASFIQHLIHVRGQTGDSPAPERCVLHLIDAHGQRIEVQLESQLVASQASAEPVDIRIKVSRTQDDPSERCPIELASSRLQLQNEIRQREQAERETRQRQQDLAHVARINTMGEMAAGLAHEINQPLTAIASYTQSCLRLLDGDAPQQAQLPNILKQIHIQAQRAANIVKHLRNFVAKGKPHRETTELSCIVRLAVSMVRNEIIHHQIALNIDSHPTLPPIDANPVQIEQVILNLLRNAIEAMDAVPADSRRLLITMDSPSPSQVSVSISDTGPGITENDSLQLTSAFFSTKKTGMGLGLAISRTIIENHGGQLTHSVNADGGATFTFTLNANGTPAAFNNSPPTSSNPDPAVE